MSEEGAMESSPDTTDRELARLLSLSRTRNQADYRRLARLSTKLDHDLDDGKRSAILQALLAEYDSLRQESMNSINNRTQILMLGLTAIAALTAAPLTIDDLSTKPLLVHAIFSAAIPLVCAFILLVWVSEAVRAHRVGYHLAAETEARINALLGRLVVSWEASLWTGFYPRDEKGGPSMMALVLIGILAGLAPAFGLVVLGSPMTWATIWPALGPPYLFLLLVAGYVARQLSRLGNIPRVSSRIVAPEGTAETVYPSAG